LSRICFIVPPHLVVGGRREDHGVKRNLGFVLKATLAGPPRPRTRLWARTRLQRVFGDHTRRPLTSISSLGGGRPGHGDFDDVVTLEYWFRQRAQIEERLKDLKHGAALCHLPSGYKVVNVVWMWAALLAMNI
jgi:hypothetical protein